MKKTPHNSGFTLIELVLALGVCGFCLTSIFGLLPLGLASNQNAINQTVAANVAAGVLSDLYATPSGATVSPRFQFSVTGGNNSNPQTLYFAGNGSPSGLAEGGNAVLGGTGASIYRATVWITQATGTRFATAAHVLITWPAIADSIQTAIPSHFTGSYETVIALDRN